MFREEEVIRVTSTPIHSAKHPTAVALIALVVVSRSPSLALESAREVTTPPALHVSPPIKITAELRAFWLCQTYGARGDRMVCSDLACPLPLYLVHLFS